MSTMYALTQMTGKEASANRTVVIGTIEFNWRVWIILCCAFPVAILVTAAAWLVMGQIALIMLPLVEGGAVFLIHRRQSTGLRLRTYEALRDVHKAKKGLNTFQLCWRQIDVGTSDYRVVMSSAVPYRPTESRPDALVDTLTERPVPVGVVPVAELDPPDQPDLPEHEDLQHQALPAPIELPALEAAAPAPPQPRPVRAVPQSVPQPFEQRAEQRAERRAEYPSRREPQPVGAPAEPRAPLDALDRRFIGRETSPDDVDVSAWLDDRHHEDRP